MTQSATTPEVRLGTATGRAVVGAAALGSALTFLDGSIINIALPSIGRDLDANLSQLQWINNGYLLSLASLILLGGSLGDHFGRRRMFVIGTIGFALTSLLCGIAPTAELLIIARILQGVSGALLTPGSLAMIQGAFRAEDRAAAIGAWSGLGGIGAAAGPFIGGVLIDYASWRWIFLINLPLALVTVVVALRAVPESRDPDSAGRFDVAGAALAATSLAAITYALIQWGDPIAAPAVAVWLLAGCGFLLVESRREDPMVPLGLFRSRTFSSANLMTLLVYAALGAVFFFLALELQTVAGYTALQAGVATLPVTFCMLFLAARGGRLATRIGPRIPMSLGPVVVAAGTLLLLRVGPDTNYWTDVFPGLVVFGLGLALLVAPLTATVLAAAPDEHAGIASGINNAVARAGSLLAIAALPLVAGLSGNEYADPVALDAAYSTAMVTCAVLLTLGGLVTWFTIRPTVLLD